MTHDWDTTRPSPAKAAHIFVFSGPLLPSSFYLGDVQRVSFPLALSLSLSGGIRGARTIAQQLSMRVQPLRASRATYIS